MKNQTPLERITTRSLLAGVVILIMLASFLSSCITIIETTVPTAANDELTPTVQIPATQELTLVSPTEVATEMPTVTLTPEPTVTARPETTKEIQPLTEYSDVRIPDSISFLATDNGQSLFTAIGVISGFGTNETEFGILNGYILVDIGKGKFKVLTSTDFPFGAGLLDGRCVRQNNLMHYISNFEEIMPYLAIGKGISVRYIPGLNRDVLCNDFSRLGGSFAFTDEECMNSLSDESIGKDDLNYLNSVIEGEVVTSEPVILGIINIILVSKIN